MNFEFDYRKLLGKMRENGLTQESLAKRAHMGAASLNLKLNNKREFRQTEILKIAAALFLELDEIGEYFYTLKSKV